MAIAPPVWWIVIGGGPLILSALALPALAWGPGKRAPRKPSLADQLAILPGGIAYLALTLLVWDAFHDLHRVAHGDAGVARPGQLADLLMLYAAGCTTFGPAVFINAVVRRLIPPFDHWLQARERPPEQTPSRWRRIGYGVYYLLLAGAGLVQGVLGALEPWAR